MIKFLESDHINKQKWDDCVNNSAHPSIFAFTWYLDLVCKNWSGLILGDYEAVFPMATRSKYKINYLFQPFFTRYFGVYAKNKINEKLVVDFFEAIPDKYKYFEFCIHESNVLQSKKYELSTKQYQFLDLNDGYEQLKKGFSDNVKRNIKKAIKAGLRIELGIAPEKIVELFKITKGNELEIFGGKDYSILIKLMKMCVELNKGKSIAVYDGDRLCAAAFFMFSNDRYTFLKSGVTEIGKTKGAMHLLFDYFIREHAGKKNQLDFGGSSVENIGRFYRSFGAKDCLYLQVRSNRLPSIVRWVKSLKKQSYGTCYR